MQGANRLCRITQYTSLAFDTPSTTAAAPRSSSRRCPAGPGRWQHQYSGSVCGRPLSQVIGSSQFPWLFASPAVPAALTTRILNVLVGTPITVPRLRWRAGLAMAATLFFLGAEARGWQSFAPLVQMWSPEDTSLANMQVLAEIQCELSSRRRPPLKQVDECFVRRFGQSSSAFFLFRMGDFRAVWVAKNGTAGSNEIDGVSIGLTARALGSGDEVMTALSAIYELGKPQLANLLLDEMVYEGWIEKATIGAFSVFSLPTDLCTYRIARLAREDHAAVEISADLAVIHDAIMRAQYGLGTPPDIKKSLVLPPRSAGTLISRSDAANLCRIMYQSDYFARIGKRVNLGDEVSVYAVLGVDGLDPQIPVSWVFSTERISSPNRRDVPFASLVELVNTVHAFSYNLASVIASVVAHQGYHHANIGSNSDPELTPGGAGLGAWRVEVDRMEAAVDSDFPIVSVIRDDLAPYGDGLGESNTEAFLWGARKGDGREWWQELLLVLKFSLDNGSPNTKSPDALKRLVSDGELTAGTAKLIAELTKKKGRQSLTDLLSLS